MRSVSGLKSSVGRDSRSLTEEILILRAEVLLRFRDIELDADAGPIPDLDMAVT